MTSSGDISFAVAPEGAMSPAPDKTGRTHTIKISETSRKEFIIFHLDR
jgi:hypothetical protein